METSIENNTNFSTFTETDMVRVSRCFTFSPAQVRTIKKFNLLVEKIRNSSNPVKYERKMKALASRYSDICQELYEEFQIVDYTPEQHLVFQQLRSDCIDKHNKIMLCHARKTMSKSSLNSIESSFNDFQQHHLLPTQPKMEIYGYENTMCDGKILVDYSDKHKKVMLWNIDQTKDEAIQYQHAYLALQYKIDMYEYEKALIEGIKLINQLGQYLVFFQTRQRESSDCAFDFF